MYIKMKNVGILCCRLKFFAVIWGILLLFGIFLWSFGIYYPILVQMLYQEKSGNPAVVQSGVQKYRNLCKTRWSSFE
jgi:hypothetical protein